MPNNVDLDGCHDVGGVYSDDYAIIYGDPVVDVGEVRGDDEDDVDDKVDWCVYDVGEPQHQEQGAPHEWELEAEPLSLSTFHQDNHQHADHNLENIDEEENDDSDNSHFGGC